MSKLLMLILAMTLGTAVAAGEDAGSGTEKFNQIAQFFPPMAAYTDVSGWQHKQFLRGGEFALELGDYLVCIEVPDDHVAAATGTLMQESKGH